MLKTLRILLAVVSLFAVTALFVDVTGFAINHWAWMAKIQLVPAVLSLNLLVVLGLVVATLLLGRVYCSVVCPLGVFQDIVNRLSIFFGSKKTKRLGKFRYKQNKKGLRVGVFAIFVVLIAAGFFMPAATWIATLLEPYSDYGIMATRLLRPLAVDANNAMAAASEANGNYDFVMAQQLPLSVPLLVCAIIILVVIVAMAATTGRGYCNDICPVGSLLGWLSQYSWLKPVINTDKCISCGKCGRRCKASCIDTKNHQIDYSRCVACFDCISVCEEDAISYIHPKKVKNAEPINQANNTRRAFLLGGAIVAGDAVASALGNGDGGFAPLKLKKSPQRVKAVVPPGAKGAKWLSEHCVSCQLCISNCPNEVLQVSTDLATFMQPVMDFSKGYCRPECTTCSDICPAGAILPIDTATKSATKIGTAVVDAEICISAAYGQHCGRCFQGCPTQAIKLIKGENGNLRPVVNETICIGCGACEYHCPVGTVASNRTDVAAIHVEGVSRHQTI